MTNVFISFRVVETRDMAWRLLNYLNDEGVAAFFDMDEFGVGDFRESIRSAIESSSAVVAIIGPGWLEISPDGSRSPGKWVQAELEHAFALGVPVVPVLVHGSSMPAPETLPESIRNLAFQQAASVRSDAQFASDAARVSEMLYQVIPGRHRKKWWKRLRF